MRRSSTFLLVAAMLVAPGAVAARTVIAGGHIMPRVVSGQPRPGNQVTNRYSQEQVTNRYNQEQTTDRYNGLRDGRRLGTNLGGYGGGYGDIGFGDVGGAGAPLQGPIPVRAGLPLLPPGVLFAPPPRCPLIIKIGRGLDHPARTQVISGHPYCAD